MVTQNTNQDLSSHPGKARPATTSGVSLSRSKKIAIVLFLMLSGFFLIDDRPTPPLPGNDVQEFMDGLTYQNENVAVASASATPTATSEQQPLQLPNMPHAEHSGHMMSEVQPAHSEHSLRNEMATDTATIVERSIEAPPQYHQVAQTTRPTVKFSGRIEPLY